jgi:hypothetical protein
MGHPKNLSCTRMFWLAALLLDRAGGRGQASSMARDLHLQYADAIYPLMSRGERREAVLSGDAAGTGHAPQMGLRPAGNGVLEIRPSEAP